MIQIETVTYTYPRMERPSLRDVSVEIEHGQFCAVIGANGAGKSTLCYLLSGFIPHFYKGSLSGDALVHGRKIAETPLSELAGEIGLVFANPFNQITGARFTVREEIAFGLENLGVPRQEMIARTESTMTLLGLSDLADRSPMALSGGQQQRLALASVIVMQPRLLVLDEPTSQLDPVGTREVFAALDALAAHQDMTVVLVTHKLEWAAQFADRVILLAEGAVVADGPPDVILSMPELVTYGLRPTRYTQVAWQARQQALGSPDAPLPVTLPQAIRFFQ